MKKLFQVLLTLLALILFEFGCQKDFGPLLHENLFLEYKVWSGFSGTNNIFTIQKNNNIHYSSSKYNYSDTLDQNDVNLIIQTVNSNHFFSLKDEYLPSHHIADGIYYTITIKSNTRSKKVIAFGSHRPKQLSNIISELDIIINKLSMKINIGRVKIWRKHELEEWPFSADIKLLDNMHENIIASETIFNHFKSNYQQGKEVLYYEGEWIYRLNSSGGYSHSYGDLDEFYITIHDKAKPIDWPSEIKTSLEYISKEGLVIIDTNYNKISQIFERNHYPIYFIDSEFKSGSFVYEIQLLRGNLSKFVASSYN